MLQQVLTMLSMQDGMNTKVHPQWIEQQYAWHRAVWVECAELMDHVGYKWWKKQVPDLEQIKLEIIDIWHFGMSALFEKSSTLESLAEQITEAIQSVESSGAEAVSLHEAIDRVAETSLASKGFSVPAFWQLMQAADMSFDELYVAYVGKNVLNFFRQDNGYKDGSYQKQWQGREDNEHLVELVAELDTSDEQFRDKLYQALQTRYAAVTSQAALA
ncbi:dUTP diphosphatase [bacterium]|nr:dUTP diphosphatase [bacterium]